MHCTDNQIYRQDATISFTASFEITEGAFREGTKLSAEAHWREKGREREQLAGWLVFSSISINIHARLVTELPHSHRGDLV